MKNIEFPIRHIDGNLIFNTNKECWAYYKVDGFSYEYLEESGKAITFENQLNFLRNVGLDLHFLVLPNPTDIGNIIDRTIEEMKRKDYPLLEYGVRYFTLVKESLLKETSITETAEYHYYIGIQLDPNKNRYKSVNTGLNFINSLKVIMDGFNSPLYQAFGLNPEQDILKSEIEAFRRQAEIIEEAVKSAFSSNIKRISAIEVAYVIEKTFSTRNNANDIRIRKQFEVGKRVTGIDKKNISYSAIRTNEAEFFDLQNVCIDEVNSKTLLFTKVDNDEELHVRHLNVCEMDNVYYFPFNGEWLYHLQLQLKFPITVSIRSYHRSNEMTRKMLGNAKLEFDDQRQEAYKGGQLMDSADNSAYKGTLSMEQRFKETGLPSYSTKFTFKITGETEEQLNKREEELRTQLSKDGIKVVAPFGEQINCMYEMIIGGYSMSEDYRMELEPDILSGLMFGATTNIGDNRGFYIANTVSFSKPVFIQPDLAGKAFEGLNNVVDSISVLVAGMTGKGKSVFMNLYAYLSTLMGSKGLIIDPKGDRKGWENGLPFLPKEYINVWTLGSNKEDHGALDPFRTAHDLDDGREMCLDILLYLANINMDDEGYTLITKAIERACLLEDVCVGAVLNELDNMLEEAKTDGTRSNTIVTLERLVTLYGTFRQQKLASLLIGEQGQNYRTLNPQTPLQVLMIENLELPTTPEEVARPTPKQKISTAIMLSITGWTKRFMLRSDRGIHKFILQDEASVIDRTTLGRNLMHFIVRMGRHYNTTLLKGSQNASDHNKDVANMGMKFTFCLQNSEEAIQMLDYFNLPRTPTNIEKLQKLGRGVAMFQDIYGRSAIIRINPVFQDVLDAFDSSTATKEEREREKANQI